MNSWALVLSFAFIISCGQEASFSERPSTSIRGRANNDLIAQKGPATAIQEDRSINGIAGEDAGSGDDKSLKDGDLHGKGTTTGAGDDGADDGVADGGSADGSDGGSADGSDGGSGDGSDGGSADGSDGGSADGDGGGDGSDDGDPTEEEIEEVEAKCSTGPVQHLEKRITFSARMGCSWGQNGNLSVRNGYFRAREKQTVNVAVPSGAVVCDLDLKSRTSSIHFDDYFAIHVNNNLVASSKVLANHMAEDANGLYQWDWSKVVNKRMNDFASPYCLTGNQNCKLPPHDKQGALELNLSLSKEESGQTAETRKAAALFAKLSGQETLSFTALATGDNDSVDCRHSGGEFDLKVGYIMPN